MHKVAIDSLHIVENGNPNDPNPAFKIQDPQSALQGIIRELHLAISRDPTVKKMEEVLENSNFIPAERNRPRKLGDIEVWLEARRYRRLDVYQGMCENLSKNIIYPYKNSFFIISYKIWFKNFGLKRKR